MVASVLHKVHDHKVQEHKGHEHKVHDHHYDQAASSAASSAASVVEHHQDNTHKHTVVDYQVAQPTQPLAQSSVTHTTIEERYTVDAPQLALAPYSKPQTPEASYTVDPPAFVPVSKHQTHETHEYKDIHVKHKSELKLKELFSHDKTLFNTSPPYPITDTMAKHEYYDEDGYAHSTNSSAHGGVRSAIKDKTISSVHTPKASTFTIPCHHIRIGDLVILQHRPCQVIRITTSAQTGQHRYLGVDLFTKQLHEEPCVVSHPSPSVVLHSLLGPVFKQYRLIDIRDDGKLVAMTENGEIKQGLKVVDQGNLHHKIRESFGKGSGAIRILVLHDQGKELAVDYKVVHLAHKL